MRWYDDGLKHRLRPKPQWTTTNFKSLYEDDSGNEAYHDSIRGIQGEFREHGALVNRVKFVNHCRGLVGWLGCTSSVDTHALAGPMCTLTSSSHDAPPCRLVKEDNEEQDDEEEEDEEQSGEEQVEDEEEEGGDDEEEYGDDDGPSPT
ncbi:hypothetical protein D1007_58911 [Hordeum vulgare]|nr:hypothetical protein D1007_58911 [Hordeum vulgare]